MDENRFTDLPLWTIFLYHSLPIRRSCDDHRTCHQLGRAQRRVSLWNPICLMKIRPVEETHSIGSLSSTTKSYSSPSSLGVTIPLCLMRTEDKIAYLQEAFKRPQDLKKVVDKKGSPWQLKIRMFFSKAKRLLKTRSKTAIKNQAKIRSSEKNCRNSAKVSIYQSNYTCGWLSPKSNQKDAIITPPNTLTSLPDSSCWYRSRRISAGRFRTVNSSTMTFDPRLYRGSSEDTFQSCHSNPPDWCPIEYLYIKHCFREIQSMKEENEQYVTIITALLDKMEEMQSQYLKLVSSYEALRAENIHLGLHSFAR
jgi:hypothetical protein